MSSTSGRGAPPSNPQLNPARPSGKAPAQPPASNSGRMAATPPASNSGRMAATPPASNSGRMAATPSPSASGRMPAPKPAAVPAPTKPSGRMGAALKGGSSQRIPAGRGSARNPNERGGAGAGRSARGGTKKGVGGPELMIAGGVILVLVVAVIAFYFMKTGEQREANRATEEMHATEKENFKIARERMEQADQAGRAWCQGDEGIADDKLIASLAGDEKIYNVIFSRKKKDKRGKEDEKQVSAHPEHMGPVGSLNFTNDEVKDLHMEYAFAEGRSVPLVKAVRSIAPKDGDPLNMGGSITVLIRAKDDAHFQKAKNPPPPKDPAKAPEAEKK